MNSIKPECFSRFTKIRRHSLRRDQLPSSNVYDNLACLNYTYEDYVKPCYIQCKEDCYQPHYFTNIKEQDKSNKNEFILSKNNIIFIEFRSNSRPDIIIEHFTEVYKLNKLKHFIIII